MGFLPNIPHNKKVFKHYFGIKDYILNALTTHLYQWNSPNLKEFRTFKYGERGIRTLDKSYLL